MTIEPPQKGDAEAFVRKMNAGKTGALLLHVRCAEELIECVVKLDAQLLMPPAEHLREWLAVALARPLGVQVPPPFEVGISADFAVTLEDPALRRIAMGSLRPAFGSGLVTGGLTAPSPDQALSVDIRLAAAELVAFDVFIHNPDRRRVNPNVLVGRRSVVAIDHGEAFSFLLPIIGAPDPADDPLLDVVRGHVFGTSFGSRSGISLDRFGDAISALTDDVLDGIRDATPAAWTVGPAAGSLERSISVIRARRDSVQRWLPQVQAWLLK